MHHIVEVVQHTLHNLFVVVDQALRTKLDILQVHKQQARHLVLPCFNFHFHQLQDLDMDARVDFAFSYLPTLCQFDYDAADFEPSVIEITINDRKFSCEIGPSQATVGQAFCVLRFVFCFHLFVSCSAVLHFSSLDTREMITSNGLGLFWFPGIKYLFKQRIERQIVKLDFLII